MGWRGIISPPASTPSPQANPGRIGLMNEISPFLVNHGGPVLFAIVFAEQAGLPLPSAPWLLAARALSAGGKLNPALAIGLTSVAALLSDSAWFYIGRRGGQRVLRLFCRL